ncbi:MAG TPA: dihydrolipoamide acetyltransferase family protein [Gemmatimonadales bacterium]|nr:dihydrolipoamide acetyltransferase family protein [Gemmatimonadales bacterium]
MPTSVVMEALSPTMEEGRLVKWLKHAGDQVKAGETLAEVETDKAIMDLVARADGVLGSIAAKEGETVAVGKEIAVINGGSGKGDGGRVIQEQPAPVAPSTPPPPPPPPPAPRATEPVRPRSALPPSPAPPPPTPADATRVKASPLARRMARDAGVDLRVLQGSGPGGRVVKQDVEQGGAAERQTGEPVVAEAPAAAPLVRPEPVGPPVHRPAGPPFEDVPLSQIRKTIAKRLAGSLGPIPHFFLTAEIDMERVAEARAALNERRAPEAKISINDVVLKAAALALRQHRACNAWWQEDHIRYWNEVHLGMAVAVPEGLITPVIRNADAKSLAEIGEEARALAERARARKLQLDEYTGSTFSVSNLGMFDIDQFTAVINPPEAGILAVGASVAKPVIVDGATVSRLRMRVTMSCDHRVIDGATGAAFLKTLKGMLENPLAMI